MKMNICLMLVIVVIFALPEFSLAQTNFIESKLIPVESKSIRVYRNGEILDDWDLNIIITYFSKIFEIHLKNYFADSCMNLQPSLLSSSEPGKIKIKITSGLVIDNKGIPIWLSDDLEFSFDHSIENGNMDLYLVKRIVDSQLPTGKGIKTENISLALITEQNQGLSNFTRKYTHPDRCNDDKDIPLNQQCLKEIPNEPNITYKKIAVIQINNRIAKIQEDSFPRGIITDKHIKRFNDYMTIQAVKDYVENELKLYIKAKEVQDNLQSKLNSYPTKQDLKKEKEELQTDIKNVVKDFKELLKKYFLREEEEKWVNTAINTAINNYDTSQIQKQQNEKRTISQETDDKIYKENMKMMMKDRPFFSIHDIKWEEFQNQLLSNNDILQRDARTYSLVIHILNLLLENQAVQIMNGKISILSREKIIDSLNQMIFQGILTRKTLRLCKEHFKERNTYGGILEELNRRSIDEEALIAFTEAPKDSLIKRYPPIDFLIFTRHIIQGAFPDAFVPWTGYEKSVPTVIIKQETPKQEISNYISEDFISENSFIIGSVAISKYDSSPLGIVVSCNRGEQGKYNVTVALDGICECNIDDVTVTYHDKLIWKNNIIQKASIKRFDVVDTKKIGNFFNIEPQTIIMGKFLKWIDKNNKKALICLSIEK